MLKSSSRMSFKILLFKWIEEITLFTTILFQVQNRLHETLPCLSLRLGVNWMAVLCNTFDIFLSSFCFLLWYPARMASWQKPIVQPISKPNDALLHFVSYLLHSSSPSEVQFNKHCCFETVPFNELLRNPLLLLVLYLCFFLNHGTPIVR